MKIAVKTSSTLLLKYLDTDDIDKDEIFLMFTLYLSFCNNCMPNRDVGISWLQSSCHEDAKRPHEDLVFVD